MTTQLILTGVLAFLGGAGIIFLIFSSKSKAQAKDAEQEGIAIIEKAKQKASTVRLNAKNEAKEIIAEERKNLEKEFEGRQNNLLNRERDITKKELSLEQKIEFKEQELGKIRTQQENLENERKQTQTERERFIKRQGELAEKLTQVAQMTKEEAKEELIKNMVEDARVDAAKEIRRIEEETQEEAEKKSKQIISTAIQRYAGEYVAEQTIVSVELPGDDIKGRLIGREGRNIRAFEQICGVDLIIDDTPGMVVISSFNVVRKQIAKMTIEKLIADGRIHPAKIEEFHEKSRKAIEVELRELGEKAQMEIGVHGMHPEVLKMIGALAYRSSYTQNQYQHSLEVAFVCGAMAAELGINVKQARRAGLLHDIGKTIDASAEGSHAMIGADFLKKYGEAPDIVHAVRGHHEDIKVESVLGHLVMAADALSGARPGVRKFLKESYVSRVTDIENIANGFDGVSKSYAISAGREIRVLVENTKIDDEGTVMLSRDIAKRIEEEMSYPGTIRVSVIRETKAVGIAK